MLLASASRFGADMKQERLHHAALRREQFEAIVARFLLRPVPAGGSTDTHRIVGGLLAEQKADRTPKAADSRSTVSTEGRFVPRSRRDRNPLSRPAAVASVSTVRPFSRRICRKRGPIVGLIFVGSGKFISSNPGNRVRNGLSAHSPGQWLSPGCSQAREVPQVKCNLVHNGTCDLDNLLPYGHTPSQISLGAAGPFARRSPAREKPERRDSDDRANLRKDSHVSDLPLIVFDVNETLLDLETMSPTFERIFGDKAAMRLWFANFILYSAALTVAGQYVPFTDIGAAMMKMLADTRGIHIRDSDKKELTDKFSTMPAHPEVPAALRKTSARRFPSVHAYRQSARGPDPPT